MEISDPSVTPVSALTVMPSAVPSRGGRGHRVLGGVLKHGVAEVARYSKSIRVFGLHLFKAVPVDPRGVFFHPDLPASRAAAEALFPIPVKLDEL